MAGMMILTSPGAYAGELIESEPLALEEAGTVTEEEILPGEDIYLFSKTFL